MLLALMLFAELVALVQGTLEEAPVFVTDALNPESVKVSLI